MPFYNCISPKDFLSSEQRAAIAQGITDIHCDVTGAPRQFVHVIFDEFAAGHGFSGGLPSKACLIRASIRAGRTQEVKEEMLGRLSSLWLGATPTSPHDLLVSFAETPGSNVMEGGVLLPHPNDDEAWLKQNGSPRSEKFAGVAGQ